MIDPGVVHASLHDVLHIRSVDGCVEPIDCCHRHRVEVNALPHPGVRNSVQQCVELLESLEVGRVVHE